jgi:hypothetical protein
MTPPAYAKDETIITFSEDGDKMLTAPSTHHLRERFYAAKSRSKERTDLELTNAEFLELLLNVWEEHHEPRCHDE